MRDHIDPSAVIATLLATGAKRAVKYVSDKQIIRATRPVYDGKIEKNKVKILITIGRPNYRERVFIKSCKKAGEKFPVKKIQLTFLSKKKKR